MEQEQQQHSSRHKVKNQSSDILQHSQNGLTGDRQIQLKYMTILILKKNSTNPSNKLKHLAN